VASPVVEKELDVSSVPLALSTIRFFEGTTTRNENHNWHFCVFELGFFLGTGLIRTITY